MTAGAPPDLAGRELLVLGVAWSERSPALDLTDIATGTRHRLPLLGRRLGLRVTTPGRFCTGWYGFVDGEGRLLPCPARAPAATGHQCADCTLRDQFRFAHQGHLGGYVPRELEPYLAAPQWLYIATFADGVSKVGTAAEHRKLDRLDEQGPLRASWVARTANGRLVREAEDTLSRELQLPQHRGRAAKAAALARPAPAERVEARHRETVAQAAVLVRDTVWGPGLTVTAEDWTPPPAMGVLRDPPPHGHWIPYPHRLGVGTHGLQIEACAGAAALAAVETGVDAVRFLVDLGQLKGCRVLLGPYSSPVAEVQETMF